MSATVNAAGWSYQGATLGLTRENGTWKSFAAPEGSVACFYCAWVDAVSLRKSMGVGELHVEVEGGREATNESVSLTGALKLVKDGSGTFRPCMKAQAYFGGTDVKAGTLAMYSNGRPDWECTLGALGTDVRVDSGAVVDLNGSFAIIHRFVLNGGAIENSLPPGGDANLAILGALRLDADSLMRLGQSSAFIAPGWAPARIDLQGHTLTIDGAARLYAVNVHATEGRIVLSGRTILEFKKVASDLSAASLEEGEEARVRVWPELAGAPVSCRTERRSTFRHGRGRSQRGATASARPRR